AGGRRRGHRAIQHGARETLRRLGQPDVFSWNRLNDQARCTVEALDGISRSHRGHGGTGLASSAQHAVNELRVGKWPCGIVDKEEVTARRDLREPAPNGIVPLSAAGHASAPPSRRSDEIGRTVHQFRWKDDHKLPYVGVRVKNAHAALKHTATPKI